MAQEKKKPVSKFAELQAQERKCPNCGSIIYSRRNKLCGACGEKLPAELLFTPQEREMVEKELKDAKKRTPPGPTEHDSSPPFPLPSSTDFGTV